MEYKLQCGDEFLGFYRFMLEPSVGDTLVLSNFQGYGGNYVVNGRIIPELEDPETLERIYNPVLIVAKLWS